MLDLLLGFSLADWLVLLFLLPLAASVGCRPQVHDIQQDVISVGVGTREVEVVVHTADAPGLTYVSLHEDEKTAVQATLDVIKREGGRLVQLRHTGERNISFRPADTSSADSVYTFDPNRMFTAQGLRASLEKLSTAPPSAQEAVASFADSILAIIDPRPNEALVAVHNNRDDEEGEDNYSTLRYLDGDLSREALFVYYNDAVDPDDFFYVTDRQLYDTIRRANYNVVLQNAAEVTDDGSLSVYAAQQGLSYVNVEAQRGHYEYQVKMIQFLNELLRDGG